MRSLFSVIVFSITVSSSVFGQEMDSLVMFSELKFSSNFEQQIFRDVRKRKADLFSLFIANGNLLTEAKIEESRANFNEYVGSMKVDDIKKNQKRIKYVYDNIEKKYLQKFELKNRFEEVFYNGFYNSISASAVFVLTLNKLKIPYSIKEDATRVYLIAYPNEEKIVINSVPDMGGYFEINVSFKENYVKRLKEQKVIPEAEANSTSFMVLFDKYYFDQGADITPIQLAAIQYANEALFMSSEKKPEAAYNQIKKAYALYPSDRFAYLLMVTGAAAFDAHKPKDSLHAVKLGVLSRYANIGIDKEVIVSEFTQAIQKLLFEENSRKKFEMYFRVLGKNLRDQRIIDEVSFLYNFHYGRYYYAQGRFAEALPLSERALDMRSSDVDAQALFLGSIANAYRNTSAETLAPKLEAYNDRYPVLKENNNFNLMIATVYLTKFYQSYLNGRAIDPRNSA
jgi:hypothetical protein